MNTEKDMRTWYQHTFDEVHASEDLLRKVNTMKNENEMYKAKKKLSKGAVAAAAFALLMLSNVISYAASGRAWIMGRDDTSFLKKTRGGGRKTRA
ncbi:MAG: hypothetical protein K2P27_01850, partial [Lachnospiraceae bacterium]|nr:hypothetical protein [Lachnospiraceae bacterium]